MNTELSKPDADENITDADMLPEYDFSGGSRGKHHNLYKAGHTVKIQRADGTVDVHYFTLAEGAVLLEPEVRKYFPDSQAVNNALRGLIDLIPDKETTAE